MAYEISVGPAQLTINVGECVLITETDGAIRQPSERGLFYRDTRLISAWNASVNDLPWTLLNSAATAPYAAQIVLVNPVLPTDQGDIPERTISLTVSRMLGVGGLRETLEIRNHGAARVRLALAIRIACDFADIFDVKSHRLVSRGDTETTWSAATGTLETVHVNAGFRRGVSVSAAEAMTKPALRDGALAFAAEIASQGVWSRELLYAVIDGERTLEPSRARFASRHGSEQEQASATWCAQAMRLATSHTPLAQLYARSVADLAALRLPIEGTDLHAFVPAAGIPWFVGLFGRDSLIAALQTVAIYPDFARGALDVLARYQADGFDDSRDMQPGKIPHELRRGELAELGLVPYRPYYGTADATPLYVILLHEAWRFTGDRALIDAHLETAERCLRWIDEHGDPDCDGFQEYRRLAPDGAENQGWKDSGNAILDEHGRDVPAPKALCELQGYVYDCWRRMAAIYEALDRPADAQHTRDKAQALYDRFNATFWNEELGFYALCLDPAKRPVMTIASNAGHLLWSGIVPPDRARRVADRLLAPDMWSGWGIRTLSADHPAYNPHDYQLGAIWPHDNGLIALGLKQYGFHAEAARIAKGLVDAADRFLLHRLPEVFAGIARADTPFPVQYLGVSVPQAWASGTVFFLLRSLLGARADPEASSLSVDPYLPEWLPDLWLAGFHVGDHRVDLRVWREGTETLAEITGDTAVTLTRRAFRTATSR